MSKNLGGRNHCSQGINTESSNQIGVKMGLGWGEEDGIRVGGRMGLGVGRDNLEKFRTLLGYLRLDIVTADVFN